MELSAVDRDLCSFYDFCKENNLTAEEIRRVCEPLSAELKKTNIYLYVKYVSFVVLLSSAAYLLLQVETVAWHATALGRIAMVNILPFWNWQTLFAEKCLIAGAKIDESTDRHDCIFCEAVEDVPFETDVDPIALKQLYLDVNVPVVLVDGDTPFRREGFNLTEEILTDGILSSSFPCDLSTNTMSRAAPVGTVVKQALRFNKWFVHFRICQLDAAKSFRLIVPRPRFLPVEISPVRQSWLLLSRAYNSPTFKLINLTEKIAAVIQVSGTHRFQLTPADGCSDVCSVLEVTLSEGQVLILGPLWQLRYKPGSGEDATKNYNAAVVLEAR